jgi:phospholipid/cholesterol/gamma-HCH transport system permease protein
MLNGYLRLNFDVLYWLLIGPLRRHSLGINRLIEQMIRMGVEAFPMASLTALSIGLTLAMQGARELGRLGAQQYVPGLVTVSLLRELGPLLIAGVVIARSGSSIAAELGTMSVSEEVEALDLMAIDPVRFLVVPRFLAMLIMLPLLTVMGNVVGMAGGWLPLRSVDEHNDLPLAGHRPRPLTGSL